jgi:hypothetical protein
MVPNQPGYKLRLAEDLTFLRTGDVAALSSAIAALPATVAEERFVLTHRLNYAFAIRDWRQVTQLLEKVKGGEDNNFAYAFTSVPVGCYSIVLARLQGEDIGANLSFAQTREQLNQKVMQSAENPQLLSNLAVVDALLGRKEMAIQEAKHAQWNAADFQGRGGWSLYLAELSCRLRVDQ